MKEERGKFWKDVMKDSQDERKVNRKSFEKERQIIGFNLL